MTYPMIGNYGVSKEDFESDKLQPCAFLVHELCDTPSNFRNTQTIDSLLKEYGIPCMSGLDTRAVVKKLRESGTMRGVITDDISDKDRLMQVIKDFRQEKLVESVTLREKRVRGEETAAQNRADGFRHQAQHYKQSCKARLCGDGISGMDHRRRSASGQARRHYAVERPRDPADCVDIIKEIRKFYDVGIPTFAIALGISSWR